MSTYSCAYIYIAVRNLIFGIIIMWCTIIIDSKQVANVHVQCFKTIVHVLPSSHVAVLEME